MKVVQRKAGSLVQLAGEQLKGHICPVRVCKCKLTVSYNTQTYFITAWTETAAATPHMNSTVYLKPCTGQKRLNFLKTPCYCYAPSQHYSPSSHKTEPQAEGIERNDMLKRSCCKMDMLESRDGAKMSHSHAFSCIKGYRLLLLNQVIVCAAPCKSVISELTGFI